MRILFLFFFIINSLVFSQSNISKITSAVTDRISKQSNSDEIRCWVFLSDKGESLENYYSNPMSVLSEKALLRRNKVNKSKLEFTDLPVFSDYISTLENLGFKVKHKSKWFNAVSGTITSDKIYNLSKLNFVKNIDIVYALKKRNLEISSNESSISGHSILPSNLGKDIFSYNYGNSLNQLQQVNVPAVHNLNITGQGVNIAVLDAGFNNLQHECFSSMNIIAKWDFVNNDPNVGDSTDMGYGGHGTNTLSTIGGFKEGKLIGPAFSANFILAKTENTDSETPIEEDNWIAAIEWADSIGVDVTSTSLGYIGFDSPYPSYTWQSMDGNTCRITIAADLAVAKGIVVVNSAGNEGFDQSHNTLGAPADGDSVITVGAVNSIGQRSSFSSVGNTVDGRIKPDIMAMGESVVVASVMSTVNYNLTSGTSFSCPIAAGIAALILCNNPSLTPMQVREALLNSSDRFNNPNREYGYGIPNALTALNYFPTSTVNNLINTAEFDLLQNYPNPFNPITNIRFSLIEKSFVSLKIYDVLGNEIADLVNEVRDAGIYNELFSSYNRSISSGVYFYKLSTNKFSQTKSMILIK